MKRKGFTLIELLAVIVILAIIAVIATPLVLNTIDDAKKGSFEQTLNNILKAADLYQAKLEINDEFIECRYFSFGNDVEEVTVRDKKIYYPLQDLSLKGQLPTEGEVKICSNIITLEASNGSYSGSYDGSQMNIGKGDLASNDLTTPVIDTFNTTATTNRIIVAVTSHSQSVGGVIENYYYKINDGDYVKITEKSYIFTDLEANTEYTITIKVENKSGITTEESKKVTTKSFGELTISVENVSEWTSSKEVTLTGTTDEYTIEYKIIKYNEETLELEESEFTTYTESFILDTMATEDYPTTIVVRYNDNGYYSEYKSYMITKIDTSAPTNTSPAVNASTTKPTSEANVVIRQSDNGSGLDENTIEYGYSTEESGTYTWQESSTLTSLKSGTTYYIKTRVKNNVGTLVESEVTEYTPGTISSCSVTPLTSGWATNKDVQITGSQTGTELQYQVGSTSDDNWTTIENNGTVNVTENTTVYCRLWDGTTAGGTGSGSVSQIDTTAPECTLTVTEYSISPKVTLEASCTDPETGIAKYEFSQDSGNSYTDNGTSNTISYSSIELSKMMAKVTNNVGLAGVYTIDDSLKNEIYNTLSEEASQKIAELTSNPFLVAYPVGSIYITTSSDESTAEQMNALYGGTWEAYGTGKTLVGIDEDDTNFSTVNKTGGSTTKSITLTTANLPSHTHTVTAAGTVTSTFKGSSGTTSSNGSHSHTLGAQISGNAASGYGLCTGQYNNGFGDRAYVTGGTATTSTASTHTHTLTAKGTVTSTFKGTSATTSSIGSSTSFSVSTLQSYTTVYMWKRVA